MGLYRAMADPNQPYVFAHLRGEAIKALVQDDTEWIDYVAEDRSAFDRENLVKTIISEPLLSPTLDSPHTMSA